MDGLGWKWLDSAVGPRGVVNFFKFACSTTVTGNVLLASGRVLGNLQSQMPQTIKQLHLQIKCLTNLQMWMILMYVTQYSDMTKTLGWAFHEHFFEKWQLLLIFLPSVLWNGTKHIGGWADGLWCRGASAPRRSSEKKPETNVFPNAFVAKDPA